MSRRTGAIPWVAFGLCLSGCTHVYFDSATTELGDTAAHLNNRQVLLNLAREANDEPAYFIQLGSINGSVSLSSTIGLPSSAQVTLNQASSGAKANPRMALQATGGVSATVTQNPTFTLTPLAGQQFAQAYVNPYPGAVFEALFEQGWYADILARIMINYVEFWESPVDPAEKEHLHVELWRNDPTDDKGNYPKFLEFCIELNAAFNANVILAKDDAVPVEDLKSGIDPSRATRLEFDYISPADAIAARKNHLQFRPLARDHTDAPPSKYILVDQEAPKKYLQIEPYPNEEFPEKDYPLLSKIFGHGNKGYIFVGTDPPRLAAGHNVLCLHLSSFDITLFNVAHEREKLARVFPHTDDRWMVPFGDKQLTVRPVLLFRRLDPIYLPDKGQNFVQLWYNNELYFIRNRLPNPDEERIYNPPAKNLEVFTLLVYLYNLSAIDSTKLVIPQFIQVP